MKSSVFNPPNVHTLSDCVIGKVIPSPLWPKDGVDNAWSAYASSRPQYPAHQAQPQTQSMQVAAPFEHKGMLKPVPNNPHSEIDEPDQYAAKLLIEEENAKTELRRRSSRRSSQRSRKKKEVQTIALERDVRKLQEEIQTLQWQGQTLSSGVPTGTTALSVVAEYFRLLRYGLKGKEPQNKYISSVQRDFLHAATSPDVVGETGFGVERLIEDYRRLALYLPESDISLCNLIPVPETR